MQGRILFLFTEFPDQPMPWYEKQFLARQKGCYVTVIFELVAAVLFILAALTITKDWNKAQQEEEGKFPQVSIYTRNLVGAGAAGSNLLLGKAHTLLILAKFLFYCLTLQSKFSDYLPGYY